MTQAELAGIVGVEAQHISRIERGVRACSIDLLVILATTLHVSLDYLLLGQSVDNEVFRKQLEEMAFRLSMISHGM